MRAGEPSLQAAATEVDRTPTLVGACIARHARTNSLNTCRNAFRLSRQKSDVEITTTTPAITATFSQITATAIGQMCDVAAHYRACASHIGGCGDYTNGTMSEASFRFVNGEAVDVDLVDCH
ncbi:MAG: hypothetical protein J4F40_13570 [Alphaproteobacteria bacterium]|nr:hypothetical protein [Alphaproteobacteria bacterium]MCY4499692.1 hypothetical protein [Rhodospirillaceae bacterium]